MPATSAAPHEHVTPGSLRAWAIAIRPKTLWIATIPVAVGTALAWMHGTSILPWVAALAFAASILMQLVTNLQNDVGYTARGLETGKRVGLPRATARGWVTPAEVRRAIVISHKSDVGGVLMNVKNAASAMIGYTILVDQVREAMPQAKVDGVYVQRQIPAGQEVIVGAVRDPQFGPLMMFGSGGVEVEGLKDVAFALAPLTRVEALKMIRRTWAGRKLAGFRNIPPADEEAVIDVLVNLSHLAVDDQTVQEIEINPLRVFDRGVMAVDVRMK